MKLGFSKGQIEYLQSILDGVIDNAKVAKDEELEKDLNRLRLKVTKGEYYNFKKYDIEALIEFSQAMLHSLSKLKQDIDIKDFPDEEKIILKEKADFYINDLTSILDFLSKAMKNA